jgi:ATP-dependent DNA helicase RecQ
MQSPLEVLKKYWGYAHFRPLQEEIIESVLLGKPTVALLPTGGGKSICFQVPGLLREGICLVISPLIALMKDQVESLNHREIPAAGIYSGLSAREIDVILDNCVYGNTKFLYVSPERLKTELFKARASKMNISLVAIDEAHCISQWGYDFRPSYLEIGDFLETIVPNGIIALTASATRRVTEDIMDKLGLQNPVLFRKSFARENLSYSVFKLNDKTGKLLRILKNVPGSSIIYTRTRRNTEQICHLLKARNISSEFYHGGLSHVARTKKQDKWISGDVRVMVATNAFGMGIDKPDVRTVIHVDLPPDMESYYQEAGRAGRDGRNAFSIVLYDQHDIQLMEDQIKKANPPVAYLKEAYQSLANYLKLATGSGELVTFAFDIRDFCTKFSYEPTTCYHALKRLEDFGLIRLNETFYDPSRVRILMNNEDLYRFEIEHGNFEKLIKGLLRLYGGKTFNSFVNIQEEKLAAFLHLSKDHIYHQLEQLMTFGVIDYIRQVNSPQLTFLTARLSPDELRFNEHELSEIMALNLTKMNAVINYLENLTACRTSQIAAYFDEFDLQDCGKCDNCITKKKSYQNLSLVANELLNKLESNPVSVTELKAIFPKYSDQQIADALNRLVDESVIKVSGNKVHKID